MYRIYRNTDGLEILLPDKVFEKIKRQVAKHYPNECGGIFVGKVIVDDNKAIIEKMIFPAKFKGTPVYFLRVSRFINQWLVKIFNQSNGASFYLGEWHSHPNAAPMPSRKDYDSMKRISENENIRIATPLLLIVGYDINIYDEVFYVYTNEKLVSYAKEK